MVKDYMALIDLSESENDIRSLTTNRPIASIPVGSRYRVIDFILSNIVNGGITNVGIFSESNSRSLMDHVGTGKPWDLNRKNDGMFIFNHSLNSFSNYGAKVLRNNLEYIYRSKSNSVILASSYMICNIDFADVVEKHEKSGCDITLVYKHSDNADEYFKNCYTVSVDKKTNTIVSSGKNLGFMKQADICMEIFIIKKTSLMDIIYQNATNSSNSTLYSSILNNLDKIKVNAYKFDGYVACINSINSYYKANMDMLDLSISEELFKSSRPIYTKIKDEQPTLYVKGCKVYNSLIADGCIIKGEVKNSLLGRYVKVDDDVVIDNCIILQNTHIQKGSKLTNIIIDKNADISEKTELKGSSSFPLVIEKRSILNDIK